MALLAGVVRRKQFGSSAMAVLILAIVGGYVVLRSLAATLPGDLNGDGVVNVYDLSILLSNWGATNNADDLNGDGKVDIFDLSILLSHWDDTGPVASPSPSPVATCTTSGATGAGSPAFSVAVGDPQSGDNTSAINGAITTASSHGGGTVTLSAGTYEVDGHIVLKDNVVLNGAGMNATVLKAGPGFMDTTDDGGYPVIATDGASNVTIANLEADQSADTLFAAGKVNENTPGRLSAYLVDIAGSTNVIVEHVATRDPFTYSLVANASTKFCFIRDNVTQNADVNGDFDQNDGIHVLDSSNGDVAANYVDQRAGGATDGDDGLVAHSLTGLTTHDITYAGNVVRGGNNGNDMQIAPGGEIYNLTITGNEFYGGPFGIRTGIYGAGTHNVAGLTITGNTIHNNVPGFAYPNGGEAIDIGGAEAGGGLTSATGIVIENNQQCEATENGPDGAFFTVTGTGNMLSGNTTYTGCGDAPGSNPAAN